MARIPQHVQKSLGAPEGAQLSEGAMSATARALTGVAQGVGQIGAATEAFVNEQQNIENEGHLSTARLEMRKASSELMSTITTNKNKSPAKWDSEYAAGMEAAKGRIFKEDHSPAVRNRLESDYNQFFGQTKIRLAEGALRENINRTLEATQLEVDYMNKTGNRAGANQLTQSLVDKNILPQYKADAIIRDNNLTAADESFEATVSFAESSDDLDAIKHSVTSDKDMSPDNKKKRLNEIKRVEYERGKDQSLFIQDQIDDASMNGGQLTKDRWEHMKAEGRMSFLSSSAQARLFKSIGKSDVETEAGLSSIDSQLAALEDGKKTMPDKVYNHRYKQLAESMQSIRMGSEQESQRQWFAQLHPNLRSQGQIAPEPSAGEKSVYERYWLGKVSKMKTDGLFSPTAKYYKDAWDETEYSMKQYEDQDLARVESGEEPRYAGATFEGMSKDREIKNVPSDNAEYELTKAIKRYTNGKKFNPVTADEDIQKIIDDFTSKQMSRTIRPQR